ncbi:MAG: glycosyltransferase family 4 protein [bacterium]
MSEERTRATAERLRVAYFSPLPPARSGIADYTLELLPALATLISPVLYTPDPAAVSPTVRQQYQVRPLAAYEGERWHYDVALYQMGNSSHHEPFYRLMSRFPGIMVLHDYVLHHFVAHRTVGRGDFAAFAREMGYSLGPDGVAEAWAIRRGVTEHQLSTQPLNRRAIDLSLGLLVHSRYVQQQLQAAGASCPIRRIPAPIALHQGTSRRADLPWPRDALILASLGQMTAAKQLERALRAFARLRAQIPLARYLIAGEALPEVDLPRLLAELNLGDSVHVTGYVEALDDFVDWLATADVVLNLRHPTLGETSATALRALAAGRVLVVNDAGWYAELPDDAVVKVPAQDDRALQYALESLAAQPQWRQELGQRARTYAAENHAPRQAATAYVAAIRDLLQQSVWQGLMPPQEPYV